MLILCIVVTLTQVPRNIPGIRERGETQKMKKRILAIVLALTLILALIPSAMAKTVPAGQTVGTVLFYVTNAQGEDILVSQIPVSEMESDLAAGKIDDTLHNYSILDKFVTVVHQEAQGFTVPEFVEYARSKSSVSALRDLPLEFSGTNRIEFWEIDQTGFDDMDSYTYNDLYGVERWNFPALYEQWDFAKQDYKDVNAVWESREPATFILSVRAFSQRYINTDEKFAAGDYNMEGYWYSQGLLDNQRTMRVMKPMTKDELFNKVSTANDTRYWTANIRLKAGVSVSSLGKVAAPTATMTAAGDYYYVRFASSTEGATILYNHNFISPSYTPTSPYGDTAVIVPKSAFPSGTVTMTARAVKDGYTDAGVVTLTLKSSGAEANPETPGGAWSDVPDTWYTAAVEYVMGKGLFEEVSKGKFGPAEPMTREMFITALYRLEGKPAVTSYRNFTDVTKGTPLSAAVSWAFDAGITTGTGDGSTFSPGLSITREEIAAMFYRYAKHKGRDLSAKGDLSVFPDYADTSSYGVEPLTWANGVKLINGSTGSDGIDYLLPKGTTTRAQCAQMFKNYGV
jgi:hypothetical protein